MSLKVISYYVYVYADGAPSPNRAYTTEEYLKITEEQLKATAAQNQGQTTSPVESQPPSQAPQGLVIFQPLCNVLQKNASLLMTLYA